MFKYEKEVPLSSKVRPDAITYELLDQQLHGCEEGLTQAMVYIRQSFMIHNESFHDLFLRLGAKKITDMEILAGLLHQLHGVDDRYYDESNDDTPAFAFIEPCDDKKETSDTRNKHHVNNDLTACVMRDIEFEQQQMKQYEELMKVVKEEGARHIFKYLYNSSKHTFDSLKKLLNILTTHTEMKDFGEGNTHEAWDLDTSNYFDKPNPYFLNPNDAQHLK